MSRIVPIFLFLPIFFLIACGGQEESTTVPQLNAVGDELALSGTENFSSDGLRSLDDILNDDGTIDFTRLIDGSFDPRGFEMILDVNGLPTFKPMAGLDDNWFLMNSDTTGTSTIYAVAVSGTNVYVGGDFTTINGVAANRVAMWNGTAWSAVGTGIDNGAVYALAVDGSGNLYAGGSFTTIGTNPRNRIALWDGATWAIAGNGMGTNNGFNDTVYALAVSGTTLYAGGVFTTQRYGGGASTITVNRIAQLSGGTWSAVGTGITTGNAVYALAVSGTDLYAGGDFTAAGGNAANRIARWSGSAWSALGSGMNDIVYALAVDGTTLYAGGQFTTAGGSTVSRIALWDGSGWSALTGGGMTDGIVYALAVSSTGLYGAGTFTTLTGDVAASRIAHWDGTSWGSLGAGLSADGRALAVDGSDANLYAGGAFVTAGDKTSRYIARYQFPGGTQIVACTNTLPLNASWSTTGVYDGSGNLTQTWDGSTWDPAADTCPWTCDTDYTLEGGLCINSKEVQCDTDNANPANSSDTIANVTITYTTAGGWTAPADCAWTCDTDYALEGGLCINSKEVQCDTDNDNPANSSDTIANVTITYTTVGGWTAPADCAWTCDTDYTLEGGLCINSKEVPCDTDNGNPAHSSDTIANVTITYTTAGGWTLPADCAWTCDTDYALEGGACINSKEVQCDTNNANPANSSDTIANVTITYTTADGWTLPADCAWTCDTDYALDGGLCINSKEVPCDTDNGNPAHSSDTIANVTITYTSAGGWTAPALCAWTCDTDYALDGGLCINSKEVQCDTDNANPANSTDTIANVTITFTTLGGWTLPADCAWTCDTDYTLEGGLCINSKEVNCAMNTEKPENSHDVMVPVTITYTSVGGWTAPATCDWACDGGYHWNETEMACLETLTIGWCNLQYPTDGSWLRGTVVDFYGRVYVAGLTDQTTEVDTVPQLIGQIGYGDAGTDASTWVAWMPIEPNPDNEISPDIGDNDEYMAMPPLGMAPGTYDSIARFSGDSGATWTYCNANREATEGYNGTYAGFPYLPEKNGHITVTSPCDDDPCGEPNRSVCTDANEDPFYTCSCDDDYALVEDACINSQEVDCAANTEKPANSHDIVVLVTIIYTTEEGWTSPADCAWECDTDYTEEGGLCINAKDVPCNENNDNPANSHDVVTDVTIHYAGGVWEDPALCVWECDATYHLKDGQCDPDTRNIACNNPEPLPENASWVADGAYLGDGTVDQTWDGTTYLPKRNVCPWDCNTDYTLEDGLCINSKDVDCAENTEKPINSQDIVKKVTVTYTTDGGWTTPAVCDWECQLDFALVEGACIDNMDVPCNANNDNPLHSTDVVIDVTIHYTTGGGWEAPELCEWDCDGGYAEDAYGFCNLIGGPCDPNPCVDEHKNVCADDGDGNPVCACNPHYTDNGDGLCVADTQIVPCLNTLPEYAVWIMIDMYSGTGELEQTWNGAGWAPLTDTCPWECGDGFFPNGAGTACIECLIDDDCGDNDVCTGTEICKEGFCVAGDPLDCADDNECTDNSCDPVEGCMVENNTASCEDGNELTENDVCDEGTCKGTLMLGVCGNAIAIGALPYTMTGDTTGRPNALEIYGEGCVGDIQPTADIVYEMTVETGVEYQIQVVPAAGADLAVNLIGACGASEPCLAMANDGGAGEVEYLTYTAAQSGTVFITIEGAGEYELSVGIVEMPDDDTIVTDDIVTDDIVTDDVVTDDVMTDDIVTDDVVTDDIVTDDVVTDDVVTDDVVTDDVVTDTVVTDKDTVVTDTVTTDKDTVVTDNETPDESTDELGDGLLDDSDLIQTDDIVGPKDDKGCGCTMVF